MSEQYILRVYPEAVAYSWESQVVQYPRLGAPGIQYYAGKDENHPVPIDCLLWRDEDGLVRGILNYYSVNYPPHERAGNVNLFVDPGHRRQGIATALVREANRRWGPINWSQQRYTAAGVELAYKLIRELGGLSARITVGEVVDGTHRVRATRRRKQ